MSDSLNYDQLKSAILCTYELVPEAYPQRFRGLRKKFDQTHVDFAREKGLLFDRWCSANKVTPLVSLRDLNLLEDFKDCKPSRIVIYQHEKKVVTLQDAAVLADEFALTHKNAIKREPMHLLKFSGENGGLLQTEVPGRSKLEWPRKCF